MQAGEDGGHGGVAGERRVAANRPDRTRRSGPAPATFGPYRIDAVIGRGGMGEVHQAFDTRKGRTVALKRLPVAFGEEDDFRSRFRREAELAGRLSEPHVIPIHDFGEIDGQLYIDMRLVEGADLASALRGGPLSPPRVVEIGSQVALALGAAHRAGLVHRDVKPSNILFSDAENDFVYLIDFGIASSVTSTRLTGTGVTIGTALYMAPERFSGRDDHRVDVYALCCVLYEALTGSPPFRGRDFPSLMWAHVNTPAPRLTDIRPGIPPRLSEVLARGLSKNPDHRQQRAEHLAAELRAALEEHSHTTATAPPGAPQRPRGWIAATVTCVVLLMIAVIVAVVALVTLRGPGSPDTLANRAVAALVAKDPAALDQVSCHRADGKASVQLPPQIIGLVQSATPAGPPRMTLDSEARETINLTLSVAGQPPQSAPVDLVLAVDDHTWCLNNIEAGQ